MELLFQNVYDSIFFTFFTWNLNIFIPIEVTFYFEVLRLLRSEDLNEKIKIEIKRLKIPTKHFE